jgi:hypothetical protein
VTPGARGIGDVGYEVRFGGVVGGREFAIVEHHVTQRGHVTLLIRAGDTTRAGGRCEGGKMGAGECVECGGGCG